MADSLEFAVGQGQAKLEFQVGLGGAAVLAGETTELATMQTLSQSLFFLLQSILC
jgi:hypothetical protein